MLRKAWASFTVKRALADVTRTSHQDYGAFGLDKDDLLARLWLLRDQIEHCGSTR